MGAIHLTYALLTLTGIAALGACVAAFRNRNLAFALIGLTVLGGILSGVAASVSLGRPVSPKAYAQVSRAAELYPDMDAAAQVVLDDDVITPSEYGMLADIYNEKSGRDLRDLKSGTEGKAR